MKHVILRVEAEDLSSGIGKEHVPESDCKQCIQMFLKRPVMDIVLHRSVIVDWHSGC